jgi:hypothetical protein
LLSGLLVVVAAGAAWSAPEAQGVQGGPPPGPGRAGGAGAASQPTGTGIIFGQIVDADSGHPIPGATVTISIRPGSGGAGQRPGGAGAGAVQPPGLPPTPPQPAAAPVPAPFGAPGQPPAPDRLITDGEGRFVFHDLPKATVSLTATASGFSNGSIGQTRPNGPARPIDLADGERLADVKIKLWKYAVLAGTVVDETGEPAVGITVRTLRRTTSAGRTQYSGTGLARTDDRGMFRISQLVPGDYILAIPQTQASMPAAIMESMMKGVNSGAGMGMGFMDMLSSGVQPIVSGVRVGDSLYNGFAPAADGRVLAYQTLFYSSATSSAQATPVTLRSGEERTGLNFQLRVVPTSRVAGTVTGPDGPAGSIGVRLLPASEDSIGDTGFEAATTATSADGAFVFLGVPPGQYVAKVLKQPRPQIPAELAANGLMSMSFGPGMTAAPTGTAALTLFAQAPITVTGTDVTGVSLVLNEGLKVGGRFVFDGTAQKPAPQQMQQMNVLLQSADGKNASIPGRSGQPMTDQNGVFKTPGYLPGKYLVVAQGPVGAAWMVKSASTQGRDATVAPMELKDTDINDLVITFTDQTGQLSGSAHGPAAGQTPAATVLLFPFDYRTWITNGMPPRLTRTSVAATKTGAFNLPNILAGEYAVVALDDRDVVDNQDAAFFAAAARVATRVTLSDGEKKSLDLAIVRIR